MALAKGARKFRGVKILWKAPPALGVHAKANGRVSGVRNGRKAEIRCDLRGELRQACWGPPVSAPLPGVNIPNQPSGGALLTFINRAHSRIAPPMPVLEDPANYG